MEEEDKQIFLAAAILLAASVGQKHEPVDESQVRLAVVNAHKLRKEVEKRSEIISAGQPYGLMESEKRQLGQKLSASLRELMRLSKYKRLWYAKVPSSSLRCNVTLLHSDKSTPQLTANYRPGMRAGMFSTNPQDSSQQVESKFLF